MQWLSHAGLQNAKLAMFRLIELENLLPRPSNTDNLCGLLDLILGFLTVGKVPQMSHACPLANLQLGRAVLVQGTRGIQTLKGVPFAIIKCCTVFSWVLTLVISH